MKYYKDDKDGFYVTEAKPNKNWVEITEEEYRANNPVVEIKAYMPLSAWQVRKVLNQFGLRDAVETAVKNSTDMVVKDAWNFANEFYRDNEVLINMAYSLSIAEEQLDQMYEIGINL